MTEPMITKRVKVPPTRAPEPAKADHTAAGQEVRRTWAQRILDAWRKYIERRGH